MNARLGLALAAFPSCCLWEQVTHTIDYFTLAMYYQSIHYFVSHSLSTRLLDLTVRNSAVSLATGTTALLIRLAPGTKHHSTAPQEPPANPPHPCEHGLAHDHPKEQEKGTRDANPLSVRVQIPSNRFASFTQADTILSLKVDSTTRGRRQ